MFRLAHVSDVHLALVDEPRFAELLSKRITGYINWKLNRRRRQRPDTLRQVMGHLMSNAPDHLAVTGDLVNLASSSEIRHAAGWLRDVSGQLGADEKVTVVAGNHDAYVPGSLRKVLNLWQPWLGVDTSSSTNRKDFPGVRRVDNVSVISCNSAVATPPFLATGYFSKRQAYLLSRLLEQEKQQFRVVLIHHLPVRGEVNWLKRLVGIRRFTECIRRHGAELVLHGHTHLDSLYWIKRGQEETPVVGVPATAMIPGSIMPAGGYNMFEIDGSPGRWHCELKTVALAEAGGQSFEMRETRNIRLL